MDVEPDNDEVFSSVPDDLAIGSLVATDTAGWVVGSREGGSTGLWRVELDRAQLVAEISDGEKFDGLQGTSEGVSVMTIRCLDNAAADDDGPCPRWAEVVYRFDGDGSLLTESTVFESDEPLDEIDGGVFIGEGAGAVWALVQGSLFGVDASGNVEGPVADPGGAVCALGDGLYALGEPDLAITDDVSESSGQPDGSPRGASADSSDSAGSTSRSYQVFDYDRGWQAIAGESQSLESDDGFHVSCAGEYFLVESVGEDLLLGHWSSESGWIDTTQTSLMEMPNLDVEGPYLGVNNGFVHTADNEVMERQPDGTFEITGLELADVNATPNLPPAPPIVAASERLIFGCIRDGAGGGTHTTSCDIVIRDE